MTARSDTSMRWSRDGNPAAPAPHLVDDADKPTDFTEPQSAREYRGFDAGADGVDYVDLLLSSDYVTLSEKRKCHPG